ncbi:unnamed protein product [Kluyveromyces dobzhanskii CBS 2104]|uniref:WGS project CCBQ000000000 data, contig 00046 n=1 Tax=Kluyveromyces dobzhanskii CBS 2104 TaxID=1427455 RepID=A0A0A8L7F3_9SACH|nr:unnamed protein product [Kluyveromyces dobzhanskii CBS 2104]
MGQDMANVSTIRMLHRTNYIAFVSSKKDLLHIWDDVKKQDITRIKVDSSIKNLFLSREFIVLSQGDVISIFKFGNPWNKVTADIKFGGVCEFYNGMLVYSNEFNLGQIHITRLQTDTDNIIGKGVLIKAHASAVAMVRVNKKGDMVASCSQDGTLIRVFQTDTGVLVREFRRGLDRTSIIEMRWSPDGSKLAVVSDKWTLHVFEIFNDSENKRHLLKNWVNMKYFQSEWSLCNYKMNVSKGTDRCKIAWTSDSTLVVIWPCTRVVDTFKLAYNDEESSWALQFNRRNDIPL